eukprot:365725-Chlamydomonas_euryale.AAC.26
MPACMRASVSMHAYSQQCRVATPRLTTCICLVHCICMIVLMPCDGAYLGQGECTGLLAGGSTQHQPRVHAVEDVSQSTTSGPQPLEA